MAPYQIYDDSNLPYVTIVSDEQGKDFARETAKTLGCKFKYVTKTQERQLRKEFKQKSKELRNSAIMPAITED